MKKGSNSSFFRVVLFIGMFLLLFAFDAGKVKADENLISKYEEKNGNDPFVYINEKTDANENKAFSIDYDYHLNLSITISDNGSNIGEGYVYLAGRSITVTAFDIPKWTFNSRKDFVEIRKYSFTMEKFLDTEHSFTDGKDSSNNNSQTLTLKDDEEFAIYRISYYYNDDSLIFHQYVCLNSKMMESSVTGAEDHDAGVVYQTFNFKLHLVDMYDLKTNKYSYAFGAEDADISKLDFKNYDVFTSSEKNSSTKFTKIDRDLKIDISAEDVDTKNTEKYLYLKIEREVVGKKDVFVIKTDKKYVLQTAVKTELYLINDKNEVLTDAQYYNDDTKIRFLVKFETPVKWEKLRLDFLKGSLTDVYKDYVSEDKTEFVDFIVLEWYDAHQNESYLIEGKAITIDEENTIIKLYDTKINISLDASKLPKIYVVEEKPEVVVDPDHIVGGSGLPVIGSEELDLNVKIDKDFTKIESVIYYLAECSKDVAECQDEFDDKNPNIKEAALADGEGVAVGDYHKYTYKLVVDNSFGSFDAKKLWLFVRVVDIANNVVDSKRAYKIDNIIVDPDKVDDLLYKSQDGKLFYVKVLDKYDVEEVNLKYGDYEGNAVIDDEVVSDASLYKILAVDYDFRCDVEVELVDKYGNKEKYVLPIEYSSLVDGEEFKVGDKTFVVSTSGNAEIKTQGVSFVVTTNENQYAFDSSVFTEIEKKFKLDQIANIEESLQKDLIVIVGGKIIVLEENISEPLVFPSLLKLLEKVSHLDSYKTCALKGNTCDFNTYVRYTYKYLTVEQQRLVEVSFADNTLKYMVANFQETKTVNVNAKYTDYGVSVYDASGTKIDAIACEETIVIKYTNSKGVTSTVDKVDTTKAGTYNIERSVSYNGNRSYPLNYSVVVKDNEAPVITLTKTEVEIKVGETLDLSTLYTVSDNYDEDVEVKSSWNVEFDNKKAGTYIVNFWAVDDEGNESSPVSVTVIVEKDNNITTYLIIGGIVLVVIVIIGFAISIEKKRSK